MKSFISMFSDSAKELKSVLCLTVTGMFIAISMVIESFSIDLEFAKINFAFLAIAVIGMLFGPTVGMIAGFACDIVGYIVHPTGAFLPAYVLVAGLQGLIYGVCLYMKNNSRSILWSNNVTEKNTDITLFLRAILARVIDVVVVNIFINTALNLHYGFITAESYGAALVARISKNAIELIIDIPMLFLLLPVCAMAYKKVAGRSKGVSRA